MYGLGIAPLVTLELTLLCYRSVFSFVGLSELSLVGLHDYFINNLWYFSSYLLHVKLDAFPWELRVNLA